MGTLRAEGKSVTDILGRGPVHPFPARMAPGLALNVLAKFKIPQTVLDPMMGSGTVLALARSEGHKAIGFDIDPLAVLISRVWTTAIDRDNVRDCAADVFARAKRSFDRITVRNAYPTAADDETCEFIRYWFDPYARRQLKALELGIRSVKDSSVQDALWCSFSRLIVSKQSGASRAMDLSHSRPHRVFDVAPRKPFRGFVAAVERVLQNSISKNERDRGPQPRISAGDARKLPLPDCSVGLVLTSPPYLNAIDYFRCSKFSLVWMGHSTTSLRRKRAASVGADANFTHKHEDNGIVQDVFRELNLKQTFGSHDRGVLARYIIDMRDAVGEVARVLTKGGKAVYVVGENTIRTQFIANANLVQSVAEASGLKLQNRRSRVLPSNRRYLPPPTVGSSNEPLDARMRREVVLSFRKS